MKKLILLIIVMAGMTFFLSPAKAQEESPELKSSPKLGIWADMTYVSEYIYRGVDFYGDKGAWQPSIYFDLFETGFSFGIWGSKPDRSGNEKWTELDFNPGYSFQMFKDEAYQSNVTLEYWYFGYPKNSHKRANEDQMGQVKVKWPNLFKIGDIKIIPMYFYAQKSPVASGLGYQVAGYFHELRVTTIFPIADTGHTLDIAADTVYRGNVWGLGNCISHLQLSAASSFDIGNGFTLTPGLFYQFSMKDSVNPEDEFWTQISLSKSF